MAKELGGEVSKPEKHEYGHTDFYRNGSSALFEGVSEKTAVWMSHGDAVTDMPPALVSPVIPTSRLPQPWPMKPVVSSAYSSIRKWFTHRKVPPC